MNNHWLLGACLLVTIPGFSQGRDTVLAVHKLFREQRPKNYLPAAAGAGSFLQDGGSVAGRLAVATTSGATSALIASLQNRRYGVEREALILQQYAQGVPIPADIRRRLRNRYFKRTAQDVSAGF